ncbi:MAG: hypothetical protein ACJ76Y_09850 [Thermoanaerobaculia bacterium]
MRRSCLWIVAFALFALPLSAQSQTRPICAQPKAAEQPLFFEVPGAKVGTPAPVFKTYLPNCNDCTWDLPCDTECGYDPGKGGPVTCGEYGGICTPR